MHLLFDVLLCLFAAYGLIVLVIAALQRFRTKCPVKKSGIKLVLLVKDAEEQIEYIIRNAVKKDLLADVLSENRLVVVDMDSSDKTCVLLEKLQKDFSCLDVMRFEDRMQIFDISGPVAAPAPYSGQST